MITSFAPNIQLRDVLISLKYLFLPWKWTSLKKGDYSKLLITKLEKYFSLKGSIITYDSGRTALYKALRAFNVASGDEVIIQAFTCVVVPNAVTYTGAMPVYVDVEKETFNMDPSKLEKAINKKTKAIIVQHTFGLAADLEKILKIAKKHKLKVIEDCAHSLGGTYKGQKLGTFADAAIFSFGVDKVISSVRGGALLIKNKKAYDMLKKQSIPNLPSSVLVKHLTHSIVFTLGKALYSIYLGKVILFLSRKFSLTPLILEEEEKQCKKVDWFPAQLPNCLAEIALSQLSSLDSYNKHRQLIAKYYMENLPQYQHPPKENNIFLRYALLSKNRRQALLKAKKAGVFLGDWYDTVIAPKDVKLGQTAYKKASCKVAEHLSEQVFNLPTHRSITLRKAQKIVEIIS